MSLILEQYFKCTDKYVHREALQTQEIVHFESIEYIFMEKV